MSEMSEKATLARIVGLIKQSDNIRNKSREYLRHGDLGMAESLLGTSRWVFRSIKLYQMHLADLRDKKPIKVMFD